MLSLTLSAATPEETEAIGRRLGELLAPPALILLRGELGAGKTCLTRGIARGLAVPEDQTVTSPTYAVMNHYRGRCDLVHLDLYRLQGPDDLDEIGFDEVLASSGVVVVEWSERARDLAAEGLVIELSPLPNGAGRLLRFTAADQGYSGVLTRLAQSPAG